MAFKKQFQKDDFIKALSHEWKKTSVIAKEVGCKNLLATKTLLNVYKIVLVGKLRQYNVYNAVEIIEWQWTTGGKMGTREWRLKKECEK